MKIRGIVERMTEKYKTGLVEKENCKLKARPFGITKAIKLFLLVKVCNMLEQSLEVIFLFLMLVVFGS